MRQPPPLPIRGDLLLRPLKADEPCPPGWTRCCYIVCTGHETTDDIRNWQIARPVTPVAAAVPVEPPAEDYPKNCPCGDHRGRGKR